MRVPTAIKNREMRVNMTPMIDIVFLLIIFFLVSSQLARQESQLPLPLPVAASGQQPDAQRPRVVINLLADGGMLLAGRRVTEPELQQRLGRAVADATEPPEIRIRCDRHVPFRWVQPILWAVSQSGASDVTFAVTEATP